jgi:ribosomal protein S18 acetylase RimI-like enzyme
VNATCEKTLSMVERETEIETNLEPDERRSPIRIRPYAPGDFSAMYAVWIEADLHPFTEIEVGRLLNCGGGALVAEVVAPTGETAIIGTLLWSHNGQSAWLWKLAVTQRYRHQGIARRLLRQVEQDAAAIGLSGVSLLTRETNTAAQGLYTREGWKQSTVHQFWGKRLTGNTADPKPQKEPSQC